LDALKYFALLFHLEWCTFFYRRLFPALKVRIRGLEPTKMYCLIAGVKPVDNCRYRYEHATWFVTSTVQQSRQQGLGLLDGHDSRYYDSTQMSSTAGSLDFDGRIYIHPDSPAPGSHWTRQSVISFHKMKLTNNAHDEHGHVSHILFLII
jgi:T-box